MHRLGAVTFVALALALAFAGSAYAYEAATVGSAPLFIDIPSIGTHAEVVPLGVESDGTLPAPKDPDTVGWYQRGVGIGAPGNALLDGHVDWGGRLRVFGLLRQLQPGDVVEITDVDGNVLSYNVEWKRLYDADSAPLDEIFGPTQRSAEEITLITCGGVFDQASKMYLSRWVVRAVRL